MKKDTIVLIVLEGPRHIIKALSRAVMIFEAE